MRRCGLAAAALVVLVTRSVLADTPPTSPPEERASGATARLLSGYGFSRAQSPYGFGLGLGIGIATTFGLYVGVLGLYHFGTTRHVTAPSPPDSELTRETRLRTNFALADVGYTLALGRVGLRPVLGVGAARFRAQACYQPCDPTYVYDPIWTWRTALSPGVTATYALGAHARVGVEARGLWVPWASLPTPFAPAAYGVCEVAF